MNRTQWTRKGKQALLSLLLLVVTGVKAQQPPFWYDIQQFKKSDSVQMPAANSILFVGSSSFTKWTDMQTWFPNYTVINRGFGGSSLPDVIRYADDIIFPYQPKQIIVYCGDNDLAASDTVSAATVANRFIQLFQLIRNRMPAVEVDYVSIKPSPSRAKLMPKMVEANVLIKAFLRKQTHAGFIDVFTPMLNKKGQPREELFVEDRLHMNATGYKIWQQAIQPYLIKK
ncbi:GDSL-type esterase/lipase family protein [Filimonas lacunae]|nr:GDSL-type esterase/lipase family protein [Filimonas lacunae]BAV04331.1 hypothetical protein FLA_0318 [Filimonas lacunae]